MQTHVHVIALKHTKVHTVNEREETVQLINHQIAGLISHQHSVTSSQSQYTVQECAVVQFVHAVMMNA